MNIINDTVELTQSEPWGYTNRHFASLLAQIRPWPSPFVIHSVNHWGKAPTRRLEHICTPAGCHIEVEYIQPIIPVRLNSCNGTNSGSGSSAGSNANNTTPTVILLHGIGGSSKEIYIEQAAIQFVEKGWNVVILNYSKLSVVEVDNNDATDMPSSTVSVGGNCLTDTHDISFLVSHIRKKHSGFLCCIGFSMGGTKIGVVSTSDQGAL